MAMLYDDGDLSHEFADDEDARIERLENVKAAVEDEIAAIQRSRQDKAIANRLQSKLKSESALRHNVEEELRISKAREASALKAVQDDRNSDLAHIQQLEAKVNLSKQESADMQASLRSLQAEVDRLHHEKQQQQPPINYASDLNAAAAREANLLSQNKSLVADIESLRRQLDWSSYCVKDLGLQVQQVESLGFKINRNISRNSYGPVAPPTSSGPPPYVNGYNAGYGHQMAPYMSAAAMTGPYEPVNPQVSAPHTGPYPAISYGPMTVDRSYNGHGEAAVNTPSSVGAISLSPMHSQGRSDPSPTILNNHDEADPIRVEEAPVQTPPPVIDGQAFLAKLQQKGERPRADDSATEQASTYSAVPVLLAEPSATSLALPAPLQASRAGAADGMIPMPVEANNPATTSTGVTLTIPEAVAQKPARPFYIPAMPQEHLATLDQAARGQYHQSVTAAAKQLVSERLVPSGPYYVTPFCSPEAPRVEKNGAQLQGVRQDATAAAEQGRAEQKGEGAVELQDEKKGQRRHRRQKPSDTQGSRQNVQQTGGTETSDQTGEASDARPQNNKSRVKRKKRGGRTL